MPKSVKFVSSLFVFAGFGLFIGLYYGHCLFGWWGWDDTQILKSAFQYSPWEYFFVPSPWREFQPANLNPWIIFTYDWDLAFFGLSPLFFYIHHLIALWLLACTTYILLRVWVNRLWSAFGVLTFLLSASVTNTVYQLMTRHYLEGLLFLSLASIFFVRAVGNRRFVLSCIAAVFYFMAVSAKEVYVILPFLLLMIPGQDLRKRMITLTPLFSVLMFYIFWRKYMLGAWIGGYGTPLDWHVICPLILKIPEFIFGNGLPRRVASFSAIALILYWGWRNRSIRVLIIGSFLLLVGPILPAMGISDPLRLLFFITWALSLAVALCLGKWVNLHPRFIPLALVTAALIGFSVGTHGWAMRPALERAGKGFETHGRFVMEGSRNQALVPDPAFGNWFLSGMVWLRKHMLGSISPAVVYDEIDLLQHNADIESLFCFDPRANSLYHAQGGTEAVLSAWEEKRQQKPLQVNLKSKNGVISWEFGPYDTGRYSIITYGESGSKMDVPKQGSRRKDLTQPLTFRVRYDAPEGWITYSKLFQFDGKILVSIEDRGKSRF